VFSFSRGGIDFQLIFLFYSVLDDTSNPELFSVSVLYNNVEEKTGKAFISTKIFRCIQVLRYYYFRRRAIGILAGICG